MSRAANNETFEYYPDGFVEAISAIRSDERNKALACDGCGGTGNITIGECGCRGTGRITEMLASCREMLFDCQTKMGLRLEATRWEKYGW